MECEYCKKVFATRGNLNFHKKTAKYCLNLRETDNEAIKCQYCSLTFTRKSGLQSHLISCKEKDYFQYKNQIESLQEIIKSLKEENKELKNQIIDLASKAIEKPNNHIINHNNNSNNKMIDNRTLNMVPFTLTPESIQKTFEEKFTENHLMKGQKGVAEICVEKMLKDKDQKYLLKCTDPSRKIFIYIDEDGKIQKDVNADKLTKMLYEPVKHVTKNIYNELQTNYFDKQNFKSEEDDENMNNEDEERLSYATDKVIEITSLKSNNLEFVRGLIPPLTC
jgi:hypothetical protein